MLSPLDSLLTLISNLFIKFTTSKINNIGVGSVRERVFFAEIEKPVNILFYRSSYELCCFYIRLIMQLGNATFPETEGADWLLPPLVIHVSVEPVISVKNLIIVLIIFFEKKTFLLFTSTCLNE